MKVFRATPPPRPVSFRLRLGFAFGLLALGGAGLIARAVQLQLVQHDFLAKQGTDRFQRVVSMPSHRGMITDRYGEPLAVSTPVDSVWVNPQELAPGGERIPALARAARVDPAEFSRRLAAAQDREFLYVARGLQPADAARVRNLALDGVYLRREYRRYYPAGEVTGQLLGFTSIDDAGQEGTELLWDGDLAGEGGLKRVIQDRMGRQVQAVESLRAVRPGRDVRLSIDLRLQYLAYRELKAAVQANRARAGTAVLLDVRTGEVLAMASQPAFNPNDRSQLEPEMTRNRAAVDAFEPGSSIKPFFVAAGLASGRYRPDSVIDTGDGTLEVGGNVILHDEHHIGAAPLSVVLAKSSNVAMAKLAFSLEPRRIWGTLDGFGFGRVTGAGFPGESAGRLYDYAKWGHVDVATMSHGYHLMITPLQLARAYATLGALGVRHPVTLQRVEGDVAGERVLDATTCAQLLRLLESVVDDEGTGKQAKIPGYRVAGKTGTAWKSGNGDGYGEHHRYIGSFAGVAPASSPRLALVVVIDDPGAGKFYGGDVAAPVFATVMGGALRLLGVAPDDLPQGSEALRLGAQVAAR